MQADGEAIKFAVCQSSLVPRLFHQMLFQLTECLSYLCASPFAEAPFRASTSDQSDPPIPAYPLLGLAYPYDMWAAAAAAATAAQQQAALLLLPTSGFPIPLPAAAAGGSLVYGWTSQPLPTAGSAAEAPKDESSSGHRRQQHLAASGAPPMRPPCATAGWRSSMDVRERLGMARALIRLLKAHRLAPGLGDRLPDTVRLLELFLFRTAPSRDAYLDASTLTSRIVAAVHHRLSAASMRRLRLQGQHLQQAAVNGGASTDNKK